MLSDDQLLNRGHTSMLVGTTLWRIGPHFPPYAVIGKGPGRPQYWRWGDVRAWLEQHRPAWLQSEEFIACISGGRWPEERQDTAAEQQAHDHLPLTIAWQAVRRVK